MQGAQTATMLQYIVGVLFPMVVSRLRHILSCIFEEFHSRMRYLSFYFFYCNTH